MHDITTNNIHMPVLLAAVLSYLHPQPGESYLDLTAGYGGHAQAILDSTEAPKQMTLVDRDETAIAHLAPFSEQGVNVCHGDYLSVSKELYDKGARYDMILADIGVSSLHLDRAERGFSFGQDGPLDMRMDQRSGLTAADIVNTYSVEEITKLLRTYGEEPRAKRIAAAIIAARPLHSTAQLAELIRTAAPSFGRLHPATRSFQALRIAVNDELGQLESALPLWAQLLAPGGRLAVISFHSLEDRIVKRFFAQIAGERYDSDFQLLTKHPVVADDTEIVSNPRSRSAKLRAVAKIKTKKGDNNYANSRKK